MAIHIRRAKIHHVARWHRSGVAARGARATADEPCPSGLHLRRAVNARRASLPIHPAMIVAPLLSAYAIGIARAVHARAIEREANLDSSHLSHLAAQGLPAPGLHFPVSLPSLRHRSTTKFQKTAKTIRRARRHVEGFRSDRTPRLPNQPKPVAGLMRTGRSLSSTCAAP